MVMRYLAASPVKGALRGVRTMRRSGQDWKPTTRIDAAPDVAATFRSAEAIGEHGLVAALRAAQEPFERARVAEAKASFEPVATRHLPVEPPADLASEIRAAQNGGR